MTIIFFTLLVGVLLLAAALMQRHKELSYYLITLNFCVSTVLPSVLIVR